MKIKQVIEDCGGATKVARAIRSRRRKGRCITISAVSQWTRVPAEHCMKIARLSGGKYTVAQLRPDVFGEAA